MIHHEKIEKENKHSEGIFDKADKNMYDRVLQFGDVRGGSPYQLS